MLHINIIQSMYIYKLYIYVINMQPRPQCTARASLRRLAMGAVVTTGGGGFGRLATGCQPTSSNSQASSSLGARWGMITGVP